jgi:hypothetical protein
MAAGDQFPCSPAKGTNSGRTRCHDPDLFIPATRRVYICTTTNKILRQGHILLSYIVYNDTSSCRCHHHLEEQERQ